MMEFSLKLESNPEFTACVLTAYARAAYRLANKKEFGCKTIFDVAPALLCEKEGAELIKMIKKRKKNPLNLKERKKYA